MRWNRKPAPAAGQWNIRERRVFAWKPTPVGDYIVWLEWFAVHEQFFQPASGSPGWWKESSRNVLFPCYY